MTSPSLSKQLSIVIVNYNTYELTLQCIRSIYDRIPDASDLEIVLVDNGSDEEPSDSFENVFPQVKYIKSRINVGFAKGNNLGISYTSRPYILLLNSDTIIVDPRTFDACISKVKEYNDQVILTTRLLTERGEPQVAYGFLPSLAYELIFTTFVYKLLPKKKREDLLINFVPADNRIIKSGYITATFYLFSRHLLEELPRKKFYDDLFLYGEELFWARDAIQCGFKMYYFADISIVHLVGRSLRKHSDYSVDKRRTYQVEGEYKYLRRYNSPATVVLIYVLRFMRFLILSPFDKKMRSLLSVSFKVARAKLNIA